MAQDLVNVRYMVDDVQQSVDWYTAHLGFEEISNAAPPLPMSSEARSGSC